jgi:hypothetical protein
MRTLGYYGLMTLGALTDDSLLMGLTGTPRSSIRSESDHTRSTELVPTDRWSLIRQSTKNP